LHCRPVLHEAAQDRGAPTRLYRILEKARIDIMPLLGFLGSGAHAKHSQ
jgi:hypothetical protein